MKCTCINEQNIVSGLLSMNLVQCTYNECIFHLQFLKTNKSHTLSHIISRLKIHQVLTRLHLKLL